jgi:hypothetical protein
MIHYNPIGGIMQFESKYGPGETVYFIQRSYPRVYTTCQFCNGRGQIEGANHTVRQCPECYGRGGEYSYKPQEWQLSKVLTIGQIRIEYTPESTEGISDIFDNYKAQKEKYTETYMCYETGIGSGSIYNEKDLFKTKEEAQDACDIRNVPL